MAAMAQLDLEELGATLAGELRKALRRAADALEVEVDVKESPGEGNGDSDGDGDGDKTAEKQDSWMHRQVYIRNTVAERFDYHPPLTREVQGRHERARAAVKNTAGILLRATSSSREQALMLTHLEEALFWANADIARHPQ